MQGLQDLETALYYTSIAQLLSEICKYRTHVSSAHDITCAKEIYPFFYLLKYK